MVQPIEYFSEYEETIGTLDELLERADQVAALGQKSGLNFYWRGQADAGWGVHSSIHRTIATANGGEIENVSESEVAELETAIVDEGRDWVRPSVGARLTTVDLFARLQHHGLPTRLLDFSRDPLVAAYFACVDESLVDGRLIVAAARRSPSAEFRDSFHLPWVKGRGTRPSDWSEALYALEDHEDFLRITRQKGVFVTGGTPSTRPHRRLKTSGYSLLATDVRRCMSVALALHSWSQAEGAHHDHPVRGRAPTAASALTLRIPARRKRDILRCLSERGYQHSALFPDVDGFRLYGQSTRLLR